MMRNVSLGKKIFISFTIIAVIMLVISILISASLNRLEDTHANTREQMNVSTLQVEREVDHVVWANQLANSLLLNHSFDGELDPEKCRFGAWYQDFRSSSFFQNTSPELRRAFDALDAPHRSLHDSAVRITQSDNSENRVQIYQQQTLHHLEVMRRGIDDVRNILAGDSASLVERASQASKRTLFTVWLLMTFAVAVSIVLASLLRSKIVEPMKVLTSRSQQIASGDLTGNQLEVRSHDEIGLATQAFNQMQTKLSALVDELRTSAQRVSEQASVSSEVSAKADSALNIQAREIEQLATAMNEMSATIAEVAQHAQMTSDASEKSKQNTEQGQKVVQEVITAINTLADEVKSASGIITTLKEESLSIGSILDTIESIAEQTNLLALNAAIEAARAGEQGRGFAVVADEVRTLAARTGDATTEIKTMIERLQASAEQSVRTMDSGVEYAADSVQKANAAETALQEIRQSVLSITDMTHQIASATEEQASVVQDMDRNLLRTNELTEDTRAGTRSADEASAKVEEQAKGLLQLASRFRV
ncbi:MAG: HAMP domain-containing protein [Idiomarina sp.]|nr:HAMP domain-containing protein [Idiomarina sp.]